MTDMVLMPVSPKTEAGAIAALNRETEENGLTLLATAKSAYLAQALGVSEEEFLKCGFEQLQGGILEAST